jgi:hypothetical protein
MGPIVSVGTAKNPQEQTEYVRQGESHGPSSDGQAASSTIAEIPPPNPIALTNEKGSWKVLYPVALPRATIYLDTRESDRDGDSPMMDNDEARLPSHQAALEKYLSPNAAFVPLYDRASTGSGAAAPQAGSPPSALNLLSVAGLQTAGLAGSAVVLPATTASLERGWEQRRAEVNEGGETLPQDPESQPLVIAPPSAVPDAPSPAAWPGDPFADLLPIDGEAIQRRANAFFEQLARLSEQWKDSRVFEKLTPWFVAASVGVYEWLRLRRMRSFSTVVSENNCGPGPASLLAGEEG